MNRAIEKVKTCSTMAEALGLGAALCSAGMADGLLAMSSSHFCAARA